ncbi:Yip1 domain-containing protein [Cryptosporidium felis]|nr:Yip1 domain-containing protein [Cryptosporidium felis]
MKEANIESNIFSVGRETLSEGGSNGTLNEPVITTVKRDALLVYNKLYYFISGKNETETNNMKVLLNWDLWGPCILLLVMSSCLYVKAPIGSKDSIFYAIYFFSVYGVVTIALNALILGVKCSFFAILSLIGYCLFPFTVVSFISLFIPNFFVRLIFTIMSIVQVYRVISISVTSISPEEKKILILYPMFLFFFVVAFLVMIH